MNRIAEESIPLTNKTWITASHYHEINGGFQSVKAGIDMLQ